MVGFSFKVRFDQFECSFFHRFRHADFDSSSYADIPGEGIVGGFLSKPDRQPGVLKY